MVKEQDTRTMVHNRTLCLCFKQFLEQQKKKADASSQSEDENISNIYISLSKEKELCVHNISPQ